MPRKLSPDKLVQRLLQSTTTPLYVLNGRSQIVFANSACAAWQGETQEALLGRPCSFGQAAEAGTGTTLQLGPPPETRPGDSAVGFVLGASDGGKLRRCHFQPLATGEADEWFTLAIVDNELVSTLENRSDSFPSDSQRLHGQLLELRARWAKQHKSAAFLGVSSVSERIRSQIRLAATGARRVLLVGPPGSGREHVARSIHFGQAGDPGPLVPISCSLLDSELMQQALASFVKRQPPGGGGQSALLLQDVDQLSPAAQLELVEFLRLPGMELFIRATARRPLQRLARRGRFRRDLADALAVLTIAIPSLRDRPEDIPLLAQHFVEQSVGQAAENDRPMSGFSVDALDELAAYPWPGQVDELQQVVRECCQKATGPFITPADLPDRLRHEQFAAAHPRQTIETIDLDQFLAGMERELLERALAAAKGNKTRAASLLGIHRARLIRRLVQLGLAAPTPVRPTPQPDDEVVIFEPHPDEA